MAGNPRKRIIFVDMLSHYGGAHRVMANILPALSRDFEILVVDPYGNQKYRDVLKGKGLEVTDLNIKARRTYVGGKGQWSRPLFMIKALPDVLRIRLRIRQLITEECPEYIYTNQPSVVRLIGTMKPTKSSSLIYHCHGFSNERDIPRFLVRILNSRTGGVLAVSKATAEYLKLAGVSPNKLTVCYNGVPVGEIEHAGKQQPRVPVPSTSSGQTVFLLPAVIQKEKGQHLALEALSLARKHGANIALWLAGDISTPTNKKYMDALKQQARELNIEAHVHFLGWRDDIYAVMAKSDVVMLNSLGCESFGMVLVEAMCLGKACIGPCLGGIPEVISHRSSGLIFGEGNVRELGAAMESLASTPALRQKFGETGRTRVKQLFSIESQLRCIRASLRTYHNKHCV